MKSRGKLKAELDRVFSIWVRASHPKVCYTCGRQNTALQCGHFVQRQYLATRWEKDNCRPQCVGCNIFGKGKILDFEEHLKREIGDVRVEELKASRHQVLKLPPEWFEERISYYKALVSQIS